MHNGHPCPDVYPNDYFEDGITNGANWYNVAGMSLLYFSASHSHLFSKLNYFLIFFFFFKRVLVFTPL